MPKWLKITLFVAVGLLLVAGCVGLYVWRSLEHVPEFYRQALQLDPESQAEDSDEMLQRATDLASDLQQEGPWEALFTAEQINAWLAVDLEENHSRSLPSEVKKPRVVIEPDGVTVACRYKHGNFDTVLSLSVDAYLTDSGAVAVRIRSARAGSFPLPLDDVIKQITGTVDRAGLVINWRQIDGDPVALISIPPPRKKKGKLIKIEAFEIKVGEVYVSGSTEKP